MKPNFYKFKLNTDNRGSLVAIEELQDIPFHIKRIYYIFAAKENVIRGFHAHKQLQQVLICVHGTCTVLLDDGIEKHEIYLDDPTKGLFIDKMIWREIYDFSPDAVLLVLASEHYREEDYIRNYDDFELLCSKGSGLV